MPQVDADAGHDALLERILIDGFAALVEMQGSIDMGAAVVGHGEIHRGEPVHLAAVRKGFLVRLPRTVDDGRVAGIARRAVIKLAAEVDDLHERSFLFWWCLSVALCCFVFGFSCFWVWCFC